MECHRERRMLEPLNNHIIYSNFIQFLIVDESSRLPRKSGRLGISGMPFTPGEVNHCYPSATATI